MLSSRLIASLSAAAVIAWSSAAIAQRAGNACWAPGDLVHRPGEEIVQKRAKAASIMPPKRELAEYSPVPQRGVVRRVKLPPGVKLVALTFDLCEQPSEIAGYQGGIVDFLRQNRIKATFFFGGKWMLSHRERAQQLMTDSQFEVANHTWTHRNLRNLTGSTLTEEIRNAQTAYEQVREELDTKQCTAPDGRTPAARQAPKRLSLFRFPFGACSPQALTEAADLGLLPIQWDVSSGDPASAVSAATIAHNVLDSVRPGSIVLFHANGRGWHTEAALPAIVAGLKAKGYDFVTVSGLMAAGEPIMSETCYDLRPGDTDQPRFPRPLSASNSFGSWFNSGFPTGSTRNSAPRPSPSLSAPPRPATAIPPR